LNRKRWGALLAALLFASVAGAQQTVGEKQGKEKASGDCPGMAELQKERDWYAKQMTDWPDLAHYREVNTKVAAAAKSVARVVFMGDSITEAWSNPEFGGFFPDKPYLNRGISGQTTPQMLLRFRADVIALHPEAVVILAGTNDIAGNTGPMTLEETEGNLESMAELGRAHGIRVIFSSVMPVTDGVTTADGKKQVQTKRRPPEKILALNQWIKEYAKAHEHGYIDYFSALADQKGLFKSEMTFDGLHPNAAGYMVMGPLAEKAIQEALGKR
jgi:lysophospholipase L1-like esterase